MRQAPSLRRGDSSARRRRPPARLLPARRQHDVPAGANERLLRSCGVALVSCATQEQMQRAVLDLIGPLLEGPGAGVLCWGGEGALSAVARDGDPDWKPRALPVAAAPRLLELA